MKIIITGSLGNISKPLTQELIRQGHEVTVISSKANKQKDIEALGANAAIGSLEDAGFLAAAFAGADALFAMVPPNYAEENQVAYYSRLANNYVNAVEQTGIKRVVHLSSYGADLDKGTGYILGAHYAENILNRLQGVAITHLRPGYFYYNLLNFIDMIKHTGMIGANYGGNDKLIMVAPADIADVAAEELVATGNIRSIRYIASDDMTANEVAQTLGKAIGNPQINSWLTFTDEQTENSLLQAGMPPHAVKNIVELGASIHSGALRIDYDKHAPITLGKVKLTDFAKEFARVYKMD